MPKRKHVEITVLVEPPPGGEGDAAAAAAAARPPAAATSDASGSSSSESEPSSSSDGEGGGPPRAARATEVLGPFVVSMACAAPDPEEEATWSFEALRGRRAPPGAKHPPYYLLGHQPGATLLASTQAPPQAVDDRSTYAVGIFDRAAGTLTLAQAAGGSVARLEALAEHVGDVEVAGFKPDLSERQQQRKPRPQDVAARRAEARKLVEAFGSTRRKRQLKQREEGAVQVDRNADEERLGLLMNEVAARAATTGETRKEVMARVGAVRAIPPHDPKARQPHLAYKIAAMFPEQLLSALNVGQLMHAAEKAEDRERLASKGLVPAYIVSRLQRITDAATPQERKRRARLLALLSALLQLAAARPRLVLKPPRPAKEEGGKERPGGLEELTWQLRMGRKDVLEPLLDMFYTRTVEDGATAYVREESKRQLLVMHALVVALDVEGWAMAPSQLDALRAELKTTAGDLAARYRELGCTATSMRLPAGAGDGTPGGVGGGSSHTITLLRDGTRTLEECFPKPKTGPKQRGGR